MARKKADAKMTATEDELKVVRLALPESHHDEFRIMAAREKTNMAILARRIVMEWIDRQRKGGSK